jgi:hypothetical protein
MSFKTSPEKAHDILYCLTPRKIVVNSPKYIDGGNFVDQFKKEGFGVMSVGDISGKKRSAIARAKRLWNSDSQNPIIIEGTFESVNDMEKIFTGNYSYVYLYPNTVKVYADNIIKSSETDTELQNIKNNKTEFMELVKNCVEKNNNIYNEHCKAFGGKVFTVLI